MFFTFADTHNNSGTLYLSTTITPSHFFLSLLGQSLTTAHNQNLAIISSISLHNCSFNTSICKRSWTWTRISFAIDIPKVHSVRFGILPACLPASSTVVVLLKHPATFQATLLFADCFRWARALCLPERQQCMCEWPREEGLVPLLSRFDSQSPSGLQLDHFFFSSSPKTNRWVINYTLWPHTTLRPPPSLTLAFTLLCCRHHLIVDNSGRRKTSGDFNVRSGTVIRRALLLIFRKWKCMRFSFFCGGEFFGFI